MSHPVFPQVSFTVPFVQFHTPNIRASFDFSTAMNEFEAMMRARLEGSAAVARPSSVSQASLPQSRPTGGSSQQRIAASYSARPASYLQSQAAPPAAAVAAARPPQQLQSAAVEYDDGAGVLTPKSRKQEEARRLSEGQGQVAAPVVAHMARPWWSTADELELDDELDSLPPAALAAAPPQVASPFKARLAVRFGAPEAIPFGAPVGVPFGVPALASGLRATSSVSVASPAASRLLPPLEWADAHASGPRSLLTRTPAAHTSEPRSLLARTPAKGAAAKGQRPPAVAPASSSSGGPAGADGSALPHFARRSSLRPATLESFTAAKEAEGPAKKVEDAAVAAVDVAVASPAMAEANAVAAAEAEKAAEKATTEKAAAEKAAAEKAAAEKAAAEKAAAAEQAAAENVVTDDAASDKAAGEVAPNIRQEHLSGIRQDVWGD